MEKLLTIAGSDCSGGAGIQADLKTFAAHKTYGMSVITSVTAQNTMGVTGFEDVSSKFIGLQIDEVFTDIYPDAVKIGMVSSNEIIEIIHNKLVEYDAKNIVVDPVMVATSGNSLMDSKAIGSLKKYLLPIARIITPNLAEAEALSGIKITNKKDMEKAASIIGNDIEGAVLIKGGHLDSTADDLLFEKGEYNWIRGNRIDNDNTHGTGCTLSSAIAANLAKGMNNLEAVTKAKEYITGAIKDGFNIGSGRGPLNHLYNL